MRVVGVDTNIILDYWLDRSGGDTLQKLIFEAQRGQLAIYVPSPVYLECEWVLRDYYQKTKKAIVALLDSLFDLPSPAPEEAAIIRKSLDVFARTPGVNFDDCVIFSLAKSLPVDEFMTNDRQLRRLFGTGRSKPG